METNNDEVRIDLESGLQDDNNVEGSPDFSVPFRRQLKNFRNVVGNLTQGIASPNLFANNQTEYSKQVSGANYDSLDNGSNSTEESGDILETRIYSALFSLEFRGTIEDLEKNQVVKISKQALEAHLSSASPDPYVAWRDWNSTTTSGEICLSNVISLGLCVRSYNNALPFSIYIKSDNKNTDRWNVVLLGDRRRGILRMMPYSTCHQPQIIVDHRRCLGSSAYKEYALGCFKRFQAHIVPIGDRTQDETFALWVHSKLAMFIKEKHKDILTHCDLDQLSLEEHQYQTNSGVQPYYSIPLNVMTVSLAMYAQDVICISTLNDSSIEDDLSFSIHPTASNWKDVQSKENNRSSKTIFEIGVDLELYFSYSPDHLLNT